MSSLFSRMLGVLLAVAGLLALPAASGAGFQSQAAGKPEGTVLYTSITTTCYISGMEIPAQAHVLYVSRDTGQLVYYFSTETGQSNFMPIPDTAGAVCAGFSDAWYPEGALAYVKDGKLWVCNWQKDDDGQATFGSPQQLAELGEGSQVSLKVKYFKDEDQRHFFVNVCQGDGQVVRVFCMENDGPWQQTFNRALGGEGPAPAAQVDSQQRTHVVWFPQSLGGLFYALYPSNDSDPAQTRVCPTSQQGAKMALDSRQQPWLAYPANDGSLWQAFLHGQGYTVSAEQTQPLITKSEAWPAGSPWRDYAPVAWEDGQGCLLVAGEDKVNALRFNQGALVSQQTVLSGVAASMLSCAWEAETSQLFICLYDETSGEIRSAWGSLDQ